MGLPQLDFRVPESTWFKSVIAGRFGGMPSMSATGTLAWPYKIAVVAVMTLVAGGTLVTFGSAGAETPGSAEISALPGSDEASPSVEGQMFPSTALLNGADLLSSLNLTDYSPGATDDLSLSDEDDEESDDDDGDEDTESATASTSAATTSTAPTTNPTTGTTNPTTSPTTSAPTPKPTTAPPTTPAPSPTTPTTHTCSLEEVMKGEGNLGGQCS